ncbi:GNAT family N-acetyltransferase [Microvirga antarctica]|uniref:GNAT family N-acetyltransferase n=1 Tax=Microvirga antarctica TaxID=2819233 RepID=UPI001B30A94A|nr:GNAT family N-acetyltransferase [Microvirga antarctica]
MSAPFRDNAADSRFEWDVDGQTIFATYERRGTDLLIKHVEAPLSLRGTGLAGHLMAAIVELARAEERRVVPLCGYARAWILGHSDRGAAAGDPPS